MTSKRLWVGIDRESREIYVYDCSDKDAIVDNEVWLYAVAKNTWIKVDRKLFRKKLRPSENPEAERAYLRKFSQVTNPNHRFGDGLSDILDMKWAGGARGDVANTRRRYE